MEKIKKIHINVDEFATELIESYIHTLFNHVDRTSGIRKNFATYNRELLDSLAQAVSIILQQMEKQTVNEDVDGYLKDIFVNKLTKCYNIVQNDEEANS